MSQTIYTKILTGEIPSYKVYEDDRVYAFLDIAQVTPGHTLVIPKQHTTSVLETEDELAGHVFLITTKLAKHITTTLQANGCNILTNAHAAAGQEIFHFHVHIIPRFHETDGFMTHFTSSLPTAERLLEVQQLLQTS